ncbi:MAG: hypothetical protein PVJ67_04695 [Candidatus Pacearchaeota archaeon]|jgi:hypothetical protein
MEKRKIKNKKINLIFGMFFLIGILFLSLVNALSYSSSNPNYGAFNSYVSSSEISEAERCSAGQDFIIQIAPFGCTPAVVRSDLLEEQNVPVFCQLAATKINPLIDVEAIESISFSGEYPKSVSGISFHPARAALGVRGDLNSPLLENIGYVVIVLRKEEVEKNMPEEVSGNLTARIKYDIKNAFGIGKASFYLPELTDSDFEDKKNQFSFWNGKGYIRADSIDEDSAEVSIYNDLRRVSTTTLKKGETSGKINLPDLDCLANLKLRLDGLEAPDTRARFEINGEIVEVTEGEYFLDNNCRVTKLDKKGVVEYVNLRCKTDEGTESFSLRVSPRVKLEFDGADSEGYLVGDYLYSLDNGKSVYLGYLGTNRDSWNEEDLYGYLIALPEKKEKLASNELSEVALIASEYEYQRITGVKVVDFIINVYKNFYAGTVTNFYLYLKDGHSFARMSYADTEETKILLDKAISISGFASFYDAELSQKVKLQNELERLNNEVDNLKTLQKSNVNDPEYQADVARMISESESKIKNIKSQISNLKDSEDTAKENYETAMADYDKILENYPNEPYEDITAGEEALYRKIILAFNSQQGLTASRLCEDFKSGYPKSKKDLSSYCDDKLKLANEEISTSEIVLSNVVKRIFFEGITEPEPEEYSAEIRITGPNKKVQRITLRKNSIIYLRGFRDEDKNEFIQLVDLDKDKAKIKFNLYAEGIVDQIRKATVSSDTKTISLDSPTSFGSDYVFTLQKVNLKNVAKVSVIPNVDNAGTSANFSFKVGIEKRAIQLSPEQTKEKIENLDKTINDWQDKSDKLGKVVKGLKGACLATGAYYAIKNFWANTGGKGIARKRVMTGTGGWNERCSAMVGAGKYSTLEECLFDKSDEIDKEVNLNYNVMAKQNEEIKAIEDLCPKTEFLIETHIDTNCFKEKFAVVVKDQLEENLDGGKEIIVGTEKVKVSEILEGVNADSISIEELRRLQLNSRLGTDMANSQIEKDLQEIYVNTKTEVELKDVASQFGQAASDVAFVKRKDSKEVKYSGQTYGDIKNNVAIITGSAGGDEYSAPVNPDDNTPVQTILTSDGKKYVAVLEKSGDNYAINSLYDFNGNPVEDKDLMKSIYFKKYDSSSYENKFESVSGEKGVVVKFYETDPYKGLPALVPFDLKNGWYAATKQTLSVFGGISSYDESGRVTSIWVCNVGENGIAEFKSGVGDDICRQVNLGAGQPINKFPGLSDSDAITFVKCAVDAIEDASNYKSGSDVSIRTQCGGSISVKVGSPAVDVPEIQCTDYMPPSECKILFNVCDPVICPSSRCNLGGNYYVKDVIQSGIIGSIALCLPNYRQGIYVPVCLTGIKAGIDGYLSVVKAHRDCLQESFDTGATVGICDEIYSINLCEFFWRQGLPLAKLVLPKLIEYAFGQNVHGGGEYLGVADAWSNAESSINYFTQYYALNSFEAFKARTAEEVGGEVCKNFASGVYPDGGSLLDSLTEPDSPVQYHGWFSEIEFTTATVPAISQYKVFYHIYAGEDQGAYYQVYLTEGEESSFYQDTSYRRVVDSGYIKKGGYADETKDFTAPAGYKKLCIRVNNEGECGFKQMSTSYAINYVEDKYLEEQASQTDIKTESECISGTASAYSLVNPNLQEGVNEVVDPAIYNRGIIRICSTDNPGKGTDESRWSQVGYCDNEKIKCWIDRESVQNVIEDLDIENNTLSTLANNSLSILVNDGECYGRDYVEGKIKEKETLMSQGKYLEAIELVNSIIDKVCWNDQRIKLLFNRGDAYSKFVDLPMIEIEETAPEKIEIEKETETPPETTDLVCGKKPCGTASATGGSTSVTQTQYIMGGDECLSYTANEVIKIANKVRDEKLASKDYLSDKVIQKEIGVSSFGCFVAMVARQEGCLAHCKYKEGESDPLYCKDGSDKSLVIVGDLDKNKVPHAFGIMQLNDIHGEHYAFTDNVDYASNYLIRLYKENAKTYNCRGVNYDGWEAALRGYNGWPPSGCSGDPDYVENVVGRKNEIINLVPECEVDSETLCENYCEEESEGNTFYSYTGFTKSQCDEKEADQNYYAYSENLNCCCYFEKGLVAESASDVNNQ